MSSTSKGANAMLPIKENEAVMTNEKEDTANVTVVTSAADGTQELRISRNNVCFVANTLEY